MKDLGDKIDAKEKENLIKEKDELKELLKAGDSDKIKAKMDVLNKKVQEASSKLYAQAAQQEQKAKHEEVKEEKVVEAEILEEEGKKA